MTDVILIEPDLPLLDGAEEISSAKPRRRTSRAKRIFMKPRRLFVFLHRWVSLVLMAWLVIIGLTGAYLAEQHAIEARLHPDRYEHGEGDLGAKAAYDAVAAVKSDEGEISYFVMPNYGRGVYEVNVSEPAPDEPMLEPDTPPTKEWTYFVDPATAHINAKIAPEDGFSNWVYRGHMYLWQDTGLFAADNLDDGWCLPEPDGIKGLACKIVPSGANMVGYFAVGWLAILLTGIYVWFWPGIRRFATALRVRRSRGSFTFNLDLHRSLGFVFWLPLVVVVFTGIGFSFENVKGWYQNVTPAQEDFSLWDHPEDLASGAPDGREALDVDGAVAALRTAMPERAIDSVAEFPADESGTWQFWVDYGFSPWTREGGGGNSLVAIDQYSGEVLYDGTPEDGNVADQAWDDWSFPLHSGDFGGPFTRALWVLVGLSPIALAVTGVVMYLLRRRKRKKARSRRAAAAATGDADVIDLDALAGDEREPAPV